MDSWNSFRSEYMEEYKICAERADRNTALIWSLAGGLLSLSAGGLLFAGQSFVQVFVSANELSLSAWPIATALIVTEIVGWAAMVVIQWWNKVANRWNSQTTVWYIRMQEIERISGVMWANRDIAILDLIKTNSQEALVPEEEERLRFLRTSGIIRKYHSYSTDKIWKLRQDLADRSGAAWMLLILIETVVTAFYFAKLGVLDNSSTNFDIWALLIGAVAIAGFAVNVRKWNQGRFLPKDAD